MVILKGIWTFLLSLYHFTFLAVLSFNLYSSFNSILFIPLTIGGGAAGALSSFRPPSHSGSIWGAFRVRSMDQWSDLQ